MRNSLGKGILPMVLLLGIMAACSRGGGSGGSSPASRAHWLDDAPIVLGSGFGAVDPDANLVAASDVAEDVVARRFKIDAVDKPATLRVVGSAFQFDCAKDEELVVN